MAMQVVSIYKAGDFIDGAELIAIEQFQGELDVRMLEDGILQVKVMDKEGIYQLRAMYKQWYGLLIQDVIIAPEPTDRVVNIGSATKKDRE
jgi:hypothetical protein